MSLSIAPMENAILTFNTYIGKVLYAYEYSIPEIKLPTVSVKIIDRDNQREYRTVSLNGLGSGGVYWRLYDKVKINKS